MFIIYFDFITQFILKLGVKLFIHFELKKNSSQVVLYFYLFLDKRQICDFRSNVFNTQIV
jgi:hypothetical protein